MAEVARIPPSMQLQVLDKVLPDLVDNGLPYGGEFLCADLVADERTAAVIALLIWHGFLPMGGMGMLLPKIHEERCILTPAEIHVSRKVRRRAKGFHLTVNGDWWAVVRCVQRYTFTSHEGDCWLTDELARAYQAVSRVDETWRRGGAAFHSVELWDTASKELVAGEIGYTCGSMYSSCTGFTLKERYPGAGTVQLAALGKWLARSGFSLWDLGMELPYKLELGGRSVPRSDWVRHVRALRHVGAVLAGPPEGPEASALTLIAGHADDPGGDGASAGACGTEAAGAAEGSAASPPTQHRRKGSS